MKDFSSAISALISAFNGIECSRKQKGDKSHTFPHKQAWMTADSKKCGFLIKGPAGTEHPLGFGAPFATTRNANLKATIQDDGSVVMEFTIRNGAGRVGKETRKFVPSVTSTICRRFDLNPLFQYVELESRMKSDTYDGLYTLAQYIIDKYSQTEALPSYQLRYALDFFEGLPADLSTQPLVLQNHA